MKKLFTLLFVLFATLTNINAATQLSTTFSGWSENVEVTENSITFKAAWSGAGAWVYGDAGLDISANQYIWVEFAEGAKGQLKMYVQAKADCSSTSKDINIDDGANMAGAKLSGLFTDDADLKVVSQICIQAKTANSKVVIKGIYVGSEEEYNNAVAGNKQQSSNLTLDNLGSGWGESTYDAATHTITIGNDWSGKGWWFGTGSSALQVADYDQLLIQFDPATEQAGNVVVEYADGTTADTKSSFEAGATSVIVDLDPTGKAGGIKQIYIQGPAGSKYTLKTAMIGTKNAVATATGIAAIKAGAKAHNPNAPLFNLAGQRVSKSYKGVVVQDGHKFLNK